MEADKNKTKFYNVFIFQCVCRNEMNVLETKIFNNKFFDGNSFIYTVSTVRVNVVYWSSKCIIDILQKITSFNSRFQAN